jgi:anthranilate phosphoribosyltransferase
LTDAVLAGRGPVGLVETIALNAAVGLWLTGKVAEVKDGIDAARDLLLGGAVKAKIAATREFYRA